MIATLPSPLAPAPAAPGMAPAWPRSCEPLPLLGSAPSIRAVRETIARLDGTNATVLLQGESGTGKEVVARQLGARTGGAFVKVNCAAIPGELWESELFGYEPGAFTGANRHKSGKFELAGGGVIFLDEIGEMPLHLQAKLLQVLQDGEFSRLGSQHTLSVEVRVIAATNADLRVAVREGRFRADLFYRLNVIALHLPPLRDRREDVPLLLDYFLNKYAAVYGRSPRPLSAPLRAHLEHHAWPGNVRELENLVRRHVILDNEDALLPELLPLPAASEAAPAAGGPMPEPPVDPAGASLLAIGRRAAQEAEKAALLRTLEATRWNRRLAAQRLRISYKSLQNKMKRLLEVEEGSAGHPASAGD